MSAAEDGIQRRLSRMFKHHRNEMCKAEALVERTDRLELIARSPHNDGLLVNFHCRCLRKIAGDEQIIERYDTIVDIRCPQIGTFELTHLRVATELLPPNERPYNPHILANDHGLICVGSKWTPSTFSLDLLMLTAYDILRGDNVNADYRDTFNPDAIPYYQRLAAEGLLPLDPAPLI
jgi:hypothetical protein